ncbi:HNH endonuclease signature motif containing protein [Corynebacterium sp. ZY180755]
MTDFDAEFSAFLTALDSGAVVLRGFFGRKKWDFPTIAPAEAELYITAANWLFGPTKHVMQQRRTLEAIETHGFSLSVLGMICSYVEKLKGEREQWKLWRDLTEEKRPSSTIAALAKKRVTELKQTKPKRTESLRISRGSDGMSTMTYTAPQARIADISKSVTPVAKEITRVDSSKTKNQALGEAFAKLLENGGNVAVSPVIPMVSIPLEEHAQILRGEGDDLRLACSDGTELTGKEYAERALLNHGIYTILDRLAGALDNYRDERFATEKQRLAAFAENPTCVAPGCSVPFDECQMHHVIAFKNGGLTNMDNIVPLCKYHNGKNDDDWWRRLNGHVEKRGPFAYWVSAYGFKDRRNEHRLAMLGAARKLFG